MAGCLRGLSRRGKAVHQENDHNNREHYEQSYPQFAATTAHATATAPRFTLGAVSIFAACTRLTRGAVGVLTGRARLLSAHCGCSLTCIRYIRQPRMICPSDDPVKWRVKPDRSSFEQTPPIRHLSSTGVSASRKMRRNLQAARPQCTGAR